MTTYLTRLPLLERFELRVDKKETGCWDWRGYRNNYGYGAIVKKGKLVGTHRISWELYRGPIPENMCVCHKCDNRSCVNPDHLFLGTIRENNIDMLNKGRNVRGERLHTSKLTPDDVIKIRSAQKTARQLAIQFGVTKSAIDKIRTRVTWKHL
jgi:hypothetical protein